MLEGRISATPKSTGNPSLWLAVPDYFLPLWAKRNPTAYRIDKDRHIGYLEIQLEALEARELAYEILRIVGEKP